MGAVCGYLGNSDISTLTPDKTSPRGPANPPSVGHDLILPSSCPESLYEVPCQLHFAPSALCV
jgi:hypothetical protein